jgi:hypothetical protein
VQIALHRLHAITSRDHLSSRAGNLTGSAGCVGGESVDVADLVESIRQGVLEKSIRLISRRLQ